MSLKIASKSMRNSPASWIVPGGERAGVRLQRDATRKWGRRTRAVAALAHSDDKVAVWALEEDPDADLHGWHWWWGSSGGWGPGQDERRNFGSRGGRFAEAPVYGRMYALISLLIDEPVGDKNKR